MTLGNALLHAVLGSALILVVVVSTVHATAADVPKGHLQPLGSHREPDPPPREYKGSATPRIFWEHVKNRSVGVFRGMGLDSPAIKLWQSDEYILKNYGDLDVRLEKKNESAEVWGIPSRTSIKNFMENLQDEAYVISQMPTPMQRDFIVPKAFNCSPVGDNLMEANVWISSGGTHSRLHKDPFNTLNCLIKGKKRWFVIDTLKYVDDIPMLNEGQAPRYTGAGLSLINPYRIDMKKWPRMANVHYQRVDMEPGDCIYVPGGYLHQVYSPPGRNMAWTVLFAGHTAQLPDPEDEFDPTRLLAHLYKFNETQCNEAQRVPLNETDIAWNFDGKGPTTLGWANPNDFRSIMYGQYYAEDKKAKNIPASMIELRDAMLRNYEEEFSHGCFNRDDTVRITDTLKMLWPNRTNWTIEEVPEKGPNVRRFKDDIKTMLFERFKKDWETWWKSVDPENKGLTLNDWDSFTRKQLHGLKVHYAIANILAQFKEVDVGRDDDNDAMLEKGGGRGRERRGGRGREREDEDEDEDQEWGRGGQRGYPQAQRRGAWLEEEEDEPYYQQFDQWGGGRRGDDMYDAGRRGARDERGDGAGYDWGNEDWEADAVGYGRRQPPPPPRRGGGRRQRYREDL